MQVMSLYFSPHKKVQNKRLQSLKIVQLIIGLLHSEFLYIHLCISLNMVLT